MPATVWTCSASVTIGGAAGSGTAMDGRGSKFAAGSSRVGSCAGTLAACMSLSARPRGIGTAASSGASLARRRATVMRSRATVRSSCRTRLPLSLRSGARTGKSAAWWK